MFRAFGVIFINLVACGPFLQVALSQKLDIDNEIVKLKSNVALQTNGTFVKVGQVGNRPLRFFWYPVGEEVHVPAFLEGGPNPNAKGAQEKIRFFLYSQDTQMEKQELFIGLDATLRDSTYNPTAPLILITHGFSSDATTGPIPVLRDAYFAVDDRSNVIGIDWGPLAAAPWYDTAAKATEIVGEKTARLVRYLVSLNYTNLNDVHFLGHSLGAHVGGFMGAAIGAGRVGRITGLDPALPLFADVSDAKRLDPTDAAFVDVIHTAGGTMLHGGLAFKSPRGQVDFYPNGGTVEQPGCGYDTFGSCSHSRSYLYMAESIMLKDGFDACRCDNWRGYQDGGCICEARDHMGQYVSKRARGKFYLRTGPTRPFSLAF